MNRRTCLAGIVATILGSVPLTTARGDDDPLPSWNDTDTKTSIIAFVERVTTRDRPDYVPPAERIAVFDNDGTLWCEARVPLQAAFVFDELKRRTPQEPELAADPMVKAALAGDVRTLLAGTHHDGLMRVLALTHAGMTTDQFDERVQNWAKTYKHPRFGHTLAGMTYQPMQELLSYLRDNGFKTFIVSGGGADFMRVWSEEVYGIPPEQVIGSTARVKFETRDGQPVLVKTMDHLFVDDKGGKPVAIHQFIGRRPIACFGNSDGDQAMLEYTTIGNPRPSFGLIVHHTDAEREYAYDADPPSSGKLVTALAAAKQHGWVVVDMKQDWIQVWPQAAGPQAGGASSIVGEWLVEDIGGRGVVDNSHSTLEIAADGTATGDGGVNRYRGQAKIDGRSLTFGPLLSTKRGGPPALMNQETKFLGALSKVKSYRIEPTGLLHLLDGEGNQLVRLSKIQPQE